MSQIPALTGGRAIEHGIAMMVDHGGPSPAKMHVGGQAATKTAASAALTNTTTETALDSYAIPANSLVPGSTIRIKAAGIITAATADHALTANLRLGPTSTALASRSPALFSLSAVDSSANDIYYFDAIIQVRTIGDSGTAVAIVNAQEPETPTTDMQRTLVAEFSIDTKVEQTISISGAWDTANVGNSCRSDIFVVDIVNPST